MQHIMGTVNPSDATTQTLGWVLNSRHIYREMGFLRSFFVMKNMATTISSGEGVGKNRSLQHAQDKMKVSATA